MISLFLSEYSVGLIASSLIGIVRKLRWYTGNTLKFIQYLIRYEAFLGVHLPIVWRSNFEMKHRNHPHVCWIVCSGMSRKLSDYWAPEPTEHQLWRGPETCEMTESPKNTKGRWWRDVNGVPWGQVFWGKFWLDRMGSVFFVFLRFIWPWNLGRSRSSNNNIMAI